MPDSRKKTLETIRWRWPVLAVVSLFGLAYGAFLGGEAPFGIEVEILGDTLVVEYEGGRGAKLLVDGVARPGPERAYEKRSRLIFQPLPEDREVSVELAWRGKYFPAGRYHRGPRALRELLRFAGKDRSSVHFQRPVEVIGREGSRQWKRPGQPQVLSMRPGTEVAFEVRWQERGVPFSKSWSHEAAQTEMLRSLESDLSVLASTIDDLVAQTGRWDVRRQGTPEELDAFSEGYRLWESVADWCPEILSEDNDQSRLLWGLWVEWSKRLSRIAVVLEDVRPPNMVPGSPGWRGCERPQWSKTASSAVVLRLAGSGKAPPVPVSQEFISLIRPETPGLLTAVGGELAYARAHTGITLRWPKGVPRDQPICVTLTWEKLEAYDLLRFGVKGSPDPFAELWVAGLDRAQVVARQPLSYVFPSWLVPERGTEVQVEMSSLEGQTVLARGSVGSIELSWEDQGP